MATDLSHLLPGSPIDALVPTGQAGGNQVTDLSHAGTAPGSQPSTPYTSLAGEVIGHPAPVVDATAYDTPVRVSPDGAKVTADANDARPSPYTLRMGQWNTLA